MTPGSTLRLRVLGLRVEPVTAADVERALQVQTLDDARLAELAGDAPANGASGCRWTTAAAWR